MRILYAFIILILLPSAANAESCLKHRTDSEEIIYCFQKDGTTIECRVVSNPVTGKETTECRIK